jgi:hypothetical protein
VWRASGTRDVRNHSTDFLAVPDTKREFRQRFVVTVDVSLAED